jgi:pathogenesis-related protein 1
MFTRALVCIVTVSLAACSIAEAKPGTDRNDRIKPTLRPKPREEPKPKEEPKPPEFTGEETGPLVGLSAAHNQIRDGVGVPALAWSPTLARYAQDWAKHLAENGCQLAHRPNLPYGENLFWTSSGATSQHVVDYWAAEREHYDIETNSCAEGKVCGHYTQIVWAATTQIGCGMATCGQQQIWVCNYDPPGNLYNQKPY